MFTPSNWLKFIRGPLLTAVLLITLLLSPPAAASEAGPASSIRHSFLTLGARTAIVGEDDSVVWEYRGGSRDGFVLKSGNVLVAFSDRVEEVTQTGQVVFSYKLDPANKEIGTAQRLSGGRTLITELGQRPRLLVVKSDGSIAREFPLQPETDNIHLQTRMARQLPNGNFLVPHLLAFAVKEYTPRGQVVHTLRTDLDEIGGRPAENWPFTAIRLSGGRTLVTLTHGNKVVELDRLGRIVWKITNEDVHGLFKDPCGAQRLANGNTVIGSHAANTGISIVEVTPERKIVWTSSHPAAAGVHELQILTTNGKPEPAPARK